MPQKPIKLIAADDHPIVIDGIKLSLDGIDGFELIGEAYSKAALFSLLQRCSPDVLILDLNIKGDNSLEYLDQIYQFSPRIKIIIFSSYNTPSLIKAALNSKVNGYLFKDSPKEEFLKAIQTVFEGGTYVSENVQSVESDPDKTLMDDFLRKNNLSLRELEVIQLIIKGLTSETIAKQLYISKHTVQSHRKNILRKLSLHNKVDLVKFAYENNLI